MLEEFTRAFSNSLGIKLGNQSIIQSQTLADNMSQATNVLVAGYGNIAAKQGQTVLGTFNIPSETAVFVVGNGSSLENRKNAIEINSNNIYTTKIHYFANELTDVSNLETDDIIGLNKKLNDIADTEVVTGNIIKALGKKIPSNLGLSDEALSEIFPENGLINAELPEATLLRTGLNLKDARAMQESIDQLSKLVNSITGVDVDAKLNQLRQEISYLISRLTVDKITNKDYKAEQDEYIEIYTVGLADYALDSDTTFKFDANVNDEQTLVEEA
jgi:hypothetical protein